MLWCSGTGQVVSKEAAHRKVVERGFAHLATLSVMLVALVNKRTWGLSPSQARSPELRLPSGQSKRRLKPGQWPCDRRWVEQLPSALTLNMRFPASRLAPLRPFGTPAFKGHVGERSRSVSLKLGPPQCLEPAGVGNLETLSAIP